MKKRRRFRALRLALLLTILALVSLAEPRIFQFCVSKFITLEAWRNGISVQIGSIDSSIFEPLILRNSRWQYQSPAGVSTHVDIAWAEARFDWKGVLGGDTERWFQQLIVVGVSGRIILPGTSAVELPAKPSTWKAMLEFPHERWVPTPTRIQARGVDMLIENHANFVRLEQIRFLASELEAGYIRIGRMTVRQPWLNRGFRDVRGITGLNHSKLLLAHLVLEPGVEIRSLSAQVVEVAGLAKGCLDLNVEIGAFGGKIRFGARSQPDSHPLSFDANGEFIQIGVARLATFLGLSD
ncbi:MAG: hypothetical protein V4710_00045, partial [Verrucomicrobiota bacterium]